MAARNRDEIKSAINATIVAELEIVTDRNERLLEVDDVCIRKDKKSSVIATADATALDFSGADLISVDCVTNSITAPNFTLNNLDDGDVKYLKVVKDTGTPVVFTGVTDYSESQTALKNATVIIYTIWRQ